MTGADIKVRYGPSGEFIVRVNEVDSEGEVGEIDETDGESGGFGDCDENGVAQRNVTFRGWIRRIDSAPPVEGQTLENVLIAWDGNVAVPTLDKRELYAKLKLLKVRVTGKVRGESVMYELTCKSSGEYKPMGVP
jgi:hypothetical protein